MGAGMIVRLALEEDEDVVVEMARAQVAETLPHLDFDDYLTRASFHRYLDNANPTIFVVERDRKIVGVLWALIENYAFTSGIYVVQEVIYVLPEHRGSRAAVALVKEFTRWGEQMKAREIIFGISNKFQPERTAKFFQMFGAEIVGFYLKRVTV
jgi:L-amino acid N-acyltransferase YncA